MSRSIANDFNECYRAYLSKSPSLNRDLDAVLKMREMKDIFDMQSEAVKIAINSIWCEMHNLPEDEMFFEKIMDRS